MGRRAREKGFKGESLALSFLIQKGYHLRDQNFRSRFGEIDLIMIDPEGVLVFVEVKAYDNPTWVHPLEQILRQKQRLIQTAEHYIYHFSLHDYACRFDAVLISATQGHELICDLFSA